MFKSLLVAAVLQLVFSYESKLQSPLKKENSNSRITLFLRKLLLRQVAEQQEKDIEEMKKKWIKIFHTDDLNDDGIITFNERDRRIQIFIDIYTTYLEKTLRASYHCVYFGFGGKKSEIAMDEFLVGMENAYKESPSKLFTKIRKCHELWVPYIDVNRDLRISWKEYEDFVNRTYETKPDDLKTDFISWNPRLSADKIVNAKDKNGDSEITWEEYKDFRNQKSKITINALKEDFLLLNPYISVEELIDAWAAFEADDRGANDQLQKELTNGVWGKPRELSSR